MTGFETKEKSALRKKLLGALKALLIFATIIISVKFSAVMRLAAIDGIRLALFTVIPTLFPFLILSEYISANSSIFSIGRLPSVIERMFGLPSCTTCAIICGNICGFPIGARISAKLYQSSDISRTECETLIALSNNPSLAFTISGVGIALRGSVTDGVLLYFITIISAITVGLIFKKNTHFSHKTTEKVEQKFIFTSSVKNAATACISISSFIVFFSMIIAAIRELTKSISLLLVFSLFLEVSNAANLLSSLAPIPSQLSFVLTAFALAFSGISVHMQVRSLLPEEISMRRYYKMKLSQGVIAAIIALLFSFLI